MPSPKAEGGFPKTEGAGSGTRVLGIRRIVLQRGSKGRAEMKAVHVKDRG